MDFTVDDFLAAKMIGAPHTGARSASKSTIHTYRLSLMKAERLVNKELADFTEQDVMVVLAALHEQSPRTRNKDVVILRQAFEWAFRTNRYKGGNPFAGVRQAKVEDSLPRAITLEEAQRIIDAVADVAPAETIEKYQIAFTLQATSGLRIGEVTRLLVGDIRDGGIVVRGKGSKQRFVPIRPDVMERLRLYCGDRDKAEPIFVGQSWMQKVRPMTIGTFTRMFKKAVIAAGFDPDVITPHVLRHSFATHALRQTKRLEVVQDLLGHADPKTTRIYARLASADLQEAYSSLW